MDDQAALRAAVEAARALLAEERTPLETAREMTGIINAWRYWWDEMGGAEGPLSTFYDADNDGSNLPWLQDKIHLWHESVQEAKRAELEIAEAQWRQPVQAACEAIIAYATDQHAR